MRLVAAAAVGVAVWVQSGYVAVQPMMIKRLVRDETGDELVFYRQVILGRWPPMECTQADCAGAGGAATQIPRGI